MKVRQRVFAFNQRGVRNSAQALRLHRRAPNFIYWNLGSRRDCIHHHTRERTLAQFADQQAHQEMLFCFGRAREQFA